MPGAPGTDALAPRLVEQMVETGFASSSVTVDMTNRVLRDIEEAFGWLKERRSHSTGALGPVL